jgi:hypothetical protein
MTGKLCLLIEGHLPYLSIGVESLVAMPVSYSFMGSRYNCITLSVDSLLRPFGGTLGALCSLPLLILAGIIY